MKKTWIPIVCLIMFFLCGMGVSAVEETSVEEYSISLDAEDPQYGREMGYLSEEDQNSYLMELADYIHDTRFDGYTVRDVIDVSKYQYDIDWNKVKESGIDYAIIRVGFRGYGASGSLNLDEYFKKNIEGALKAGLEVGVYFFSQAITENEAVEEAKYVLGKISGYDISLPVVIDYEYAAGAKGNIGRLYNANLSKDKATKICKKFCETVLAQGYTPMVYANKAMLEKQLNASEIAKYYKVWLANYGNKTSYSGDYEFWQYTQNGTVNGIEGKVDKNFWYEAPETKITLENVFVKLQDTLTERISGADRYKTSLKIAEVLKTEKKIDKFENIVVASGQSFADALPGSYLAYLKNAPILMTNGKNAQEIKTYIKQNLEKDGTVYILGGYAAVPEGVGCGLKDFKVKRLRGATRFETNLEIMKEIGGANKTILVCTGKSFADSLSGSAIKCPILLVADTLSNDQKNYLSSLSGSKFYILGGTGAVNAYVEKQLKNYGTVKRLGGPTRFETSVMIAQEFFKAPQSAIVTYSYNYPDGLCGGPLAMSKNAPLILCATGSYDKAKAYANANGLHRGIALGGNSLISDGTVANIFGKLSVLKNQPVTKFVQTGENQFKVTYDLVTELQKSADNYFYLMKADRYDGTLIGSPIAYGAKTHEMSLATNQLSRGQIRELLMSNLVLAVKTSDGKYQAINKPVRIWNPDLVSINKSKIVKAVSKKGVQGITLASDGSGVTDARYANTKQTLLNIDLADVVGTGPAQGYVAYEYKGKTYYFSKCSALKRSIQSLNSGYEQYLYGNTETTPVVVSLCVLLSYEDDTAYLIDPAARTKGKTYYMLNVKEKKARETLEAAFLYLGEIFGQEDCFVTNWILGNEINSSKAWNYSGNLNFDEYMKRYATAYEILYRAVKAQKLGNNVAISLDNSWSVAADTYSGKNTLDAFAKKIYEQNRRIEWSISYHAYSYPLTRVDFWNDKTYTTDNTSTKYISMRNIKVLTDYATSLEKKYSLPQESIRILLTEQGYTYNSKNPKQQAEAIARAYFIAKANNRIDTFIIRAIVDAKEEVKNGLYLGIMDETTEKRISFYVYEYMDSDLEKMKTISAEGTVSPANYSKFNSAKDILCNHKW